MILLLSDTMNSFLIGLLEFGKELIIVGVIWIIVYFILNLLGIDEKTKLAIYIILWSSALIWGFLPVSPAFLVGALISECISAYQIIYKKSPTDSMAEFNDAIAQDPNNADAYFNRAIAKYNLGDNTGSILDNNKVIEINPDHADAYYNRSLAKYNQGDNEGCLSDNNRAIELNPAYGVAYFMRGQAKNNLNDLEGARLDWSKAGELGVAEAYQAIQQNASNLRTDRK